MDKQAEQAARAPLSQARPDHSEHKIKYWQVQDMPNIEVREVLNILKDYGGTLWMVYTNMRNGDPASYYVESFSTLSLDLARFNELYRQDVALVPHLVKSWEKNRRQPFVFETGADSPFAATALARELNRIDATSIVAHGTYDASGKLTSFFIFAGRPGTTGLGQANLVEMVVPFLHAAWVRSQLNWTAEDATVKPQVSGLLTPRELEVVKWLYYGKSNIEIGMILTISPLTVKNHVQKTLRKLNVLNRTQAVGKALALRIVNP